MELFKNRRIFRYSKHFGICLLTLLAVISLKTDIKAAIPMGKLEDWRFYPEASQLEITLSTAAQPRYFYLTQPPRLVVDVPNTNLGYVPTQQNYSGAIQSIRVSQLKAGVTRIVMDLAPGASLNPNQVQLQPVSLQNATRWVLRSAIATGDRTYSPFPTQPGVPPTITTPQPPGYNQQQPPVNVYNTPQPQNVYNNPPPPIGIYNNPPQPQSVYNNPPPSMGIYNNPPQPSNIYNPPQPASNLLPPVGIYNNPPQPQSIYNNPPQPILPSVPPTLTPLPPNSYSPQQPFVTVPPLGSNNDSPLPGSILPPPSFPNQSGNFNNPPLISPDFPAQNVPNNPPTSPNSRVIEFGKPLRQY